MKRFIVDIVKSCWKHDIFNLSANISFFAILSLLPMLMIFVAVMGYVLGSHSIVGEIVKNFTEAIPGADQILRSNINNLVDSRSALGAWGASFLLVISTVLFSSMERAFDVIFDIEKHRHFLKSRLLAIGVVCIIMLLLFVPSAVNLVEKFFQQYGYSVPFSSYLTGKTFFIIFAMLAYVATVTIVTYQRVYFRYAIIGALIFAFGSAIAKYIFQWYLTITFTKYNLIYGSLTALILMALWIYYLSNILLVATEVVAYLQNRRRDNGE